MKLKEFTISGTRVQVASVFLIESATDKIDYLEWFRYFKMKDTIGSWFQITMLHVWMILVRIPGPSKESEFFKRQLLKRMWEDLSQRVKLLGHFPAKERNNFLNDCHMILQAAIIAYDEGLIGSDRELAASLWRTFFEYECKDFTKLEVLVEYVRSQLKYLANLKNDDLYREKHLEWRKFNFPK